MLHKDAHILTGERRPGSTWDWKGTECLLYIRSCIVCLMHPTSFSSQNISVTQEQLLSPFYRCGNWGSGRWGYVPKQGNWDLNLSSLTPEPEFRGTVLYCVINTKGRRLNCRSPHTHTGERAAQGDWEQGMWPCAESCPPEWATFRSWYGNKWAQKELAF